MTDIPEDVMKLARECYDNLPLVYDGWDEDEVVRRIAIALAAERAAQVERMARLEEALSEARDEANEALILAGRLNGGEELQTLMRLNNDLLARAANVETLLRNWLAAEDAWDCNAGDDERVDLAKQAARRALSQEGSDA